jgi:hypothetical protein
MRLYRLVRVMTIGYDDGIKAVFQSTMGNLEGGVIPNTQGMDVNCECDGLKDNCGSEL